MASKVEICSNALLMLGAQPISDLNEDNDRARLASNLYNMTRDGLLRAHSWHCAIRRVALAPEVTAPLYDYAYSFVLPLDWLRTLSVGLYGREADYRTEGGRIVSDENPLYLRYVFRNDNEATWDAALAQTMTQALAAAMAYGITKSSSMAELEATRLREQLRLARALDGQDDPPETLGDFRLLSSRGI